MAKRGVGTTISRNGVFIGQLTNLQTPKKAADTIETTVLDSLDGYKEFMASWKDGGEIEIEGFMDIADAGQSVMDAAFESQTKDTYIIAFPVTSTGITATFFAVCTGWDIGDAVLEDGVKFKLKLKVSGKPIFASVASAGLSALSLSGGGTLTPTVAAGTLNYAYSFITATSITVTVTAVSHTLKLYVDDVYVQDLTSASPSGAIATFTAQSSKKLTVIAFEAGKKPVIYTIIATRTT